MNINVKETLEKVLAQQTYFKEIRYADDIGEWSAMIDDLTETPAIGVFFNDYSPLDWRGVPMVSCDITYIVACDMLAPSEESAIMEEFLTNVNAFISKLTPYIKAKPSEYRHWKDTVLRGVLTSVNFNAFSDCPPQPDGDFVDFLHAFNGKNHYSQYILPYFNFPIGWLIEIDHERGQQGCWSLVRQNNTIPPWTGTSVSLTSRILTKIHILANNGVMREDYYDGTLVYSSEKDPCWGDATSGSLLRLFVSRVQNNVTEQKIYGIKIFNATDSLVADLRPYRKNDGTPGLKDLVTGAFYAPQHNEGITAVSK